MGSLGGGGGVCTFGGGGGGGVGSFGGGGGVGVLGLGTGQNSGTASSRILASSSAGW